MATKKDTAAQIKAANGTDLDPTQYTAAELNTLLDLAGHEDQTAFTEALAGYNADTTTVNDNGLRDGQPVTYTHTDGKQYKARVIRVNDPETGDVALQVDDLGAEARQMTVLSDKYTVED
ncbi:hypothetical protein Q0M94_28310 (plasmid) [Deinococcus radiomollis]|uniref:hypothetical protein n=1 Tax=Deinococcus radiomollis TaxID=468916 RepID=UPI003892B792